MDTTFVCVIKGQKTASYVTRKASSLMLIVTVTSQKFKWIVYPKSNMIML